MVPCETPEGAVESGTSTRQRRLADFGARPPGSEADQAQKREGSADFPPSVTRILCYVSAFGFVCSVALVIIYHFGFRHPSITLFVPEAFKILLTFTLVALGGALIKGAIDASLDRERDKRARIEQRNERRSGILREFSEIFSQFYSVRKLYHSAKDHESIYDSNSTYYRELIRELLRRSVDLEGRYGAVKILAIHHYHLPQNELGTKRMKMQELMLRVSERKESVRENAEDDRL